MNASRVAEANCWSFGVFMGVLGSRAPKARGFPKETSPVARVPTARSRRSKACYVRAQPETTVAQVSCESELFALLVAPSPDPR